MAYFFHLKDGRLLVANRQSDFPAVLKDVENDEISTVIEGLECGFRTQEVPVVSRPEPTRKRRKKGE